MVICSSSFCIYRCWSYNSFGIEESIFSLESLRIRRQTMFKIREFQKKEQMGQMSGGSGGMSGTTDYGSLLKGEAAAGTAFANPRNMGLASSTKTLFDPQTLASLQSLIQAVSGQFSGGTAQGLSKQDAVADTAGQIAQIFKQYKESALPTIFNAQNSSGGYNSTTGQMLADDAFSRATAAGSAQLTQNVLGYNT